jgi:hypothetical protein
MFSIAGAFAVATPAPGLQDMPVKALWLRLITPTSMLLKHMLLAKLDGLRGIPQRIISTYNNIRWIYYYYYHYYY